MFLVIDFVKKLINCSAIEDIIIIGILDPEDEVIEFIPDYTSFFIRINQYYLHFESIEQFSKLRVSVVDEIRYHDVSDDDFKHSFLSIANLLLENGLHSNVLINKFELYNCRVEQDCFICDAAKILLSNGQVCFFDPSNYWGICVGDKICEMRWMNNLSAQQIDEMIITVV